MGIASWMLLWLEKGVKIPEWALHKIVCRHLSEPRKKRKETEMFKMVVILKLEVFWSLVLEPELQIKYVFFF